MPNVPYIRGAVIPTAPFVQGPVKPAGTPYISRRDQVAKLLADYNNPLEINSLADVILNSAGKKALGLNTLTALMHLQWNGTVKPILAGRWDYAALNALTNFSETLDVVANPIKALVKEGIQAVPEAIGIGPNGRRNFDMDTGNMLTDIGTEILLDPLNWISFGGKAAISAGVKAAIKPIAEEVMAEAGESAIRHVIKNAGREFAAHGDWDKAVRTAATNLAANVRTPVKLAPEVVDTLATRTSEVVARTVLPSVQKMVKAGDTFEKALMQGFWGTSFGLGWWPIKHGGTMAVQALTNRLEKTLTGLKETQGGLKLSKMDEAKQAFQTLGVLTRDVAAAENLDPSLFNVLISNTAYGVSAQLDRVLDVGEANPKKLTDELEALAKQHEFKSTKDMRRTVEAWEKQHPGVFAELLWQMDQINQVASNNAKAWATTQVEKNLDIARKRVSETMRMLLPRTTPWAGLRYGLEWVANTARYDFGAIDQMDDVQLVMLIREAMSENPLTRDTLQYLWDLADADMGEARPYLAQVREAYENAMQTSIFRIKEYLRSISQNPNHLAWAHIESYPPPASLTDELSKNLQTSFKKILNDLDDYRMQNAQNAKFVSPQDLHRKNLEQTLKHGLKKVLDFTDKPFIDLGNNQGFDKELLGSLDALRDQAAQVLIDGGKQGVEDLLQQLHAALPQGMNDYLLERVADVLNPANFSKKLPRAEVRDNLADLFDLFRHIDRVAPAVESPLSFILREYDPARYSATMIPISTDEVYYKLKFAQLVGLLQLMENETTVVGLRELRNPNQGIGQVLNMMATAGPSDQLKTAAIELKQQIEAYTLFQRTLQHLQGIPLEGGDGVRFAVMDTMMSFQRSPVSELVINFESFFDTFLSKVSDQLYSLKHSRKLGLDDLINAEDYLVPFRGKGRHTAAGDVAALQAIIRHELDDLLDDSAINIIFDSETEGFNKWTDGIYDLAYSIGKTGTPVPLLAKTNRTPSVEFLRKAEMTAEEFHAKIAKDHHLTEVEAISGFLTVVQEQLATGKPVRLVAHNSRDFDLPFLKERVRYLAQLPENEALRQLAYPEEGVPLLARVELVDTLALLRRKHGWQDLNPGDIQTLRGMLERYTLNLAQLPGVDGQELLWLQPVTKDMADRLQFLGRECMTTDINRPRDGALLLQIANGIYDDLKNIHASQAALATNHLRKTVLDSMDTNITRYLSGGEGVINAYSSYKSIDFPLIQKWFELGEGFISVDQAKRMSAVARRILDSGRSNMKRLFLLESMADEITACLVQYKALLPNWHLASQMRIPNDLGGKWAWLQFLYREGPPPKGITFTQPLEGRLKDPSPLYDRAVTCNLTFAENADLGMKEGSVQFNLGANTLDEEVAILSQELEPQEDRFIAMSKMLVETRWFRASSQPRSLRYASARKHFLDMLGQYRDFTSGERYSARKLFNEHMTDFLIEMRLAQTGQMLALRGDDLVRYMYHCARGMVVMDLADLKRSVVMGPGWESRMLRHATELLGQAKELEAKGVTVLQNGTRLILVLNKNVTLYETVEGVRKVALPEIIMPELNYGTFNGVARTPVNVRGFWSSYGLSRDAVARDLNPQVRGSAGELMGTDSFRLMLARVPEIAEHLHPELLQMLEEGSGIYAGLSFNHSALGSDGRGDMLKMLAQNLLSIWNSAVQFSAVHRETRDLYADMVLNPGLSINNSPLFKDLSDRELLDILKKAPAYRLVALVEDNKIKLPHSEELQGYRVINIRPGSVKSIQNARRLNACIVPVQTYSKMVETINRFEFQGVFKWWHKLIYTYKVGHLGSIGTLARNLMDTMFKNATEGVNLDHQFRAVDLYLRYDKAVKEMLTFSDHKEFTPASMAAWFEAGERDITPEEFQFVHDFLTDGPASMTAELEEYFHALHRKRKGMTEQEQVNAWKVFVQMSHTIMKPNGYIEQVARLAEYLRDIEAGVMPTEAFAHVAKTHFDYNLKTVAERYIELVIPFYTFTMRNLEYWVETMATKPWMAGLIRDIMTPVWNLDGEDPEEFKHNRSVQYRILAGNAEIKDNGLTLKLGPSFMDAFSLLTQPLPQFGKGSMDTGAILGRTAAPIQAGIRALAGEGLSLTDLPIVGTWLQRAQSAARNWDRTGGDPLTLAPSLFGATKHWGGYAKKGRRVFVRRPYTPRRRFFSKRYRARTYKVKPIRKTYWTRIWPKLMYPPRWRTARNVYRDLYTSTGKSRIAQAMLPMPLTGKSLRYKIRFTNPQFFLR